MRRANSRQAELLELKLELEPPPQLVKPSVLSPSPAPAASRADVARNWRRVRETSLVDNSPHPFDPQHHPSPRPTEFQWRMRIAQTKALNKTVNDQL
jgi:hypothetical protein